MCKHNILLLIRDGIVENLYNRIAVFRAERGVSRRELAEAVGVNNQTIVYVNSGNTANHVDMEIHLTGTNISLSGSDILHHT